jgi:hypothetical protein
MPTDVSARVFGAAVALGWVALLCAPPPSAAAEPCPDVEVVFARGTDEAPGVGWTGQAFIDSLRAQAGPRSVGVYAVNYPASGDFGSPDFPRTVADGIRDATIRVEFMSVSCPDTKMVLGGYSQGAVVAGSPVGPEIANHIAAVALFGTPSGQFLQKYGEPPSALPSYPEKTIQLCALGDPVCGEGGNDGAHGSYPFNGQVNEGAAFAASRL